MPLATDPNQTFKIVLKSDKGKDNPPAFIYQFSSCRELRKANEYYKKLMAAKTDKALDDTGQKKLFELLKKKLVGWENMTVKYNPLELESLLTLPEAFELFFRMLEQHPTLDDKKKLDSQSQCSSGKSAKAAKGRKIAKKRSASSTVK